jgi:hypothetical protein
MSDDDRAIVPLVMLPGNMEILLENRIAVQGISLKWSDDYPNAVILVIHGVDKEQSEALGFQTRPD